ncbi:uncharacterized protein LOC142566859 isoform X3 [Dermacentor variabilis]|uniref:uncharacterized protein LOC142566859 isoform X3 n=1 Tax=Dermacentor variabilis TaxID=34621 RepID=UPI003F5BA19F
MPENNEHQSPCDHGQPYLSAQLHTFVGFGAGTLAHMRLLVLQESLKLALITLLVLCLSQRTNAAAATNVTAPSAAAANASAVPAGKAAVDAAACNPKGLVPAAGAAASVAPKAAAANVTAAPKA